jgi:hypothetical protein
MNTSYGNSSGDEEEDKYTIIVNRMYIGILK